MIYRSGTRTGCGLIRALIGATLLPLAGFVATLPDARTAIKYHLRGPDIVTVQDVLNGRVQAGDYVTIQGTLWRVGFPYTKTFANGGALKQVYILLVSPEDPALKQWPTIEQEYRKSIQIEASDISKMNHTQRMQWASDTNSLVTKIKKWRFTNFIPIANNVKADQEAKVEPETPTSEPFDETIRDPVKRLEAETKEFKENLTVLMDFVKPNTTVTGLVKKVPDKVAEGFDQTPELKLKTPFYIEQGAQPNSGQIIICSACGSILLLELLLVTLWSIRVLSLIRKKTP